MITVTPAAVKQLQALLADSPKEGKGLRVFVEAGGCAGMQYGMALDHAKEGDAIIENEGGARVFIDTFSLKYLNGSTIDFTDELAGAGFRIRNPNATRSCGCGTSFESTPGAEPSAPEPPRA